MATRDEVALVVGMLVEAFDRKASDAMIEAYIVGVGDLTTDQLRVGVQSALRGTCHFMPKPGELRALCLTGGVGVEAQADAAWSTFTRAIDRFGAGRSVNFRDALINATVRQLGGWEFVCGKPANEFEVWVKKEFLATYARFMVSGCQPELAGYLVGTNERANGIWVGSSEWGKGGKQFQLPAPVDVDVPYRPLLLAPPARQQLTQRPADLPKMELRSARQAYTTR